MGSVSTSSGERPGPVGGGEASLERLLESLGPHVLQVVTDPHGLDVPVGDPVIYDQTERSAIAAGAIVLAVGVRPATAESDRMLAAAARAGAAAVVFKAQEALTELSRASASHGVALLSVPEEMTWTQLHAFLLNAVRFSAEPAVGGIAGVPLGDLFALSNAIAGIVGGAVTIEDPSRRVLAYSTLDQPIDAARRRSILGRQVPDSPGMRALYRRVFSSTGVMTADTPALRSMLEGHLADMDDLKPRSAIAIRAGSQAIGSIWAVHDEDRLDDESERALVEAARIAAPHVIQARAARDVERRMRAEMLLAVLDDESERALVEAARIAAPHVIQARAARDVERRMRAEMLLAVLDERGSAEETAGRLGFSTTAPLSVLAFELVGGEEALDDLHRERLVDLVVVHCEASFRHTAAVALGQTVYALLQDERELDRRRVAGLAHRIGTHAEERLGTPLLAAVGSTVESVREVARARREAERVLGVLRVDARGRTVAAIEDVQSEVVLLELRELSADHPGLARGRLQRVLAHDAEHGSGYAATLRAYLDAFGDVSKAAARISVHPNTFRYRMRRLAELFELDLENPEERLVVELQLRLLASDDARPA